MKAVQTNLCDFIAESRYFRIPDFQRPYAWKHMQGEAFWDSFKDTVSNAKRHYFGSVVFFEDAENRVIIDGQQRLTTTLLFITACYHALIDDSRKAWDHTAEDIGKTYLYNEDDGELKVILRGATTDRATFDRILRRKTLPIDEQSKLFEMYQYFLSCVQTLDKLDAYIEVLQRIDMISISLQPEDDNPQVIFENINATGEPLTDGDKIRNYALMLNTEEARNMVYNDYWVRVEKTLTRSHEYSGVGTQYITDFFKVFLTMQTNKKQVNDSNLYAVFKQYYRDNTSDQSIEWLSEVWTKILSILESFVYIRFDDDITDNAIFSVFEDDRKDRNQAYLEDCIKRQATFFIQLLEYFKQGSITRNDFRNILHCLRTQSARSDICRKSFELTHLTAQTIHKIYIEYEMKSFFDAYLWYMEGAGDPSSSRTVTDEEIKEVITNEEMGDTKAKFILRELDSAHDSYIAMFKKLDHIMPKAAYGYRLDETWKQELGDNWEIINQRFYGKLANLALVDYAPTTNKDKSFNQKLTMSNGLDSARNYTTKWIADNCEAWNMDTFRRRSQWLGDQLVELYKIPDAIVSDKITEKYGRN